MSTSNELLIPKFEFGPNLILGWKGCNFTDLFFSLNLSDNNVYSRLEGKHPLDIVEWFDELLLRDLNEDKPIVICTFSTVLANQFQDKPERIYIKRDDALVPITKVFDRDWLCHFSLGDLYERGEFEEISHES